MMFVPKSLKGVGVFSFKRLCAEARGASDYLAHRACLSHGHPRRRAREWGRIGATRQRAS
jgi:hypothetical protein